MQGMKQEALADALGDDWNQKKVSLLEAKEKIELEILEQVSKILRVPVEAFQKLDDEQAVHIISSTFNDHSIGYARTYSPTFNPIDKVVELYERMIKEKDEKIALLERMLEKK